MKVPDVFITALFVALRSCRRPCCSLASAGVRSGSMKIAALASDERTDPFRWAMIGVRLVMEGRVTTIVAPGEGD